MSETTSTNTSPSQIDIEYDEIIPMPEPEPWAKHGPKPKQLVAVEVYGYEIGRGRNKRLVVPKDVYQLAALGCNNQEIARWFDVDDATLIYNFKDILEKGRLDLKQSLRKAMIRNALNGNASVQIFLAKNLLGMSDAPQNAQDQQPLPWED